MFKYFGIAVFISFFIILYVWQNIELMKKKMELHEKVALQTELIKKNDHVIYAIERFRTMNKVTSYARNNGYREIKPNDYFTMVILNKEKKNGKSKNKKTK